MTNEEAIKPLPYDNTAYGGLCTEEVRNAAIGALEKQIPKKPTYEGDGYAPDGTFVWDEWLCPNCGSKYEADYDDYDCCPNCGQKIDWSEKDE